jgi:hypothetical protein
MTLIAASVMAAMTGIIGGEVILLGLVALPQMLRLRYDSKLAIGVVCAGGSLGTMIPPSLVLVFYGLTTSTSIGDLFVASTIPGVMLAVIYIAYVLIRCAINPKLGPPAPPELLNIPFTAKLAALKKVILPLFIIFSVLRSIYSGFTSVSEAAAMGVAGVVIAAAIRRTLNWAMIRDSLFTTMSTCGLLIWLSIGANAMVGVYNLLGHGLVLDHAPDDACLCPDGHRARLRPDLVRCPVQYHHAGRLSVAAFRSGGVLSEIRGTAGYQPQPYIRLGAAVHRAADRRPARRALFTGRGVIPAQTAAPVIPDASNLRPGKPGQGTIAAFQGEDS